MLTCIHFVQRKLRPRLKLAAAFLSLLASAAPLQAQQLLAPGAPIASFSQSYLTARWWQWALSYPTASNPISDTTGEFASAGDQGSYFFLAGAFTGDPIVRNVSVRSDQTLFFPLTNLVSVIPFYGSTEAEIRTDANYDLGVASNLSVTLDGAPALLAPGTTSLNDYRQDSPLFPLAFGPGNVYGLDPSVLDAVSVGYWVGLAPLPVGTHELRFTSLTTGEGPYAGELSAQDITYRITAVPETSTSLMLCVGLVMGAWVLRRRNLPTGQRP